MWLSVDRSAAFVRASVARPVAGPVNCGPYVRTEIPPCPAGRGFPTGENALFCQFAGQEVESVLPPEQFVADDVGRRAEDAARDGLLRHGGVTR